LNTECLLKRKKKWVPLKIQPARFPLTEQQLKQFILLAIEQYIATSKHRYAEALLYMWLAQAGARARRRGFAVADILKKISLSCINVHTKTHAGIKAKEVKVVLGNKEFFISMKLKHLIEAYADKRKKDKSIFSIDRSTLESCLRELTLDLGYNPKSFPVTPETFLERAEPYDQRYLPRASR